MNDLKNLETILSYLNTLPNKVFLVGDLNVNLLNFSSDAKRTHNLISRQNFVQIVKSSTRGDNLLDLIMIKSEQKSDIHDVQVLDLGISDHKFCLCSAETIVNKSRTQIIQRRHFANINYDLFIPEIVQMLDKNCSDGNTNMQCCQLINTIISAFTRHAPIECVKFNQDSKVKFVSSRTKQLITQRDHYYQLWKLSKAAYNYCEYKLLNKSIKKSLQFDMYNHTQHMIFKNGPWKALKTFGLNFGKNVGDIGNNACLDDINKFFINMGFPEGVDPYDTLGNYSSDDTKDGKFYVHNVTISELMLSWKVTTGYGKSGYEPCCYICKR